MNRRDLKQILSSKFDFTKWKELLLDMFKNVDFFTKTVAVDADLIKSGGQLGTIHLGDRRDIALFVFEVADHETSFMAHWFFTIHLRKPTIA